MIETPEQMESVLNAEVDRIRIPGIKAFLLPHLVRPRLHYRKWDYSLKREKFSCWLVADLGHNMGIVYSEYGHGKHDPWGAVSISGEWFARDDGWFLTLEDAVINSGRWDGPIPDDYEIS